MYGRHASVVPLLLATRQPEHASCRACCNLPLLLRSVAHACHAWRLAARVAHRNSRGACNHACVRSHSVPIRRDAGAGATCPHPSLACVAQCLALPGVLSAADSTRTSSLCLNVYLWRSNIGVGPVASAMGWRFTTSRGVPALRQNTAGLRHREQKQLDPLFTLQHDALCMLGCSWGGCLWAHLGCHSDR